MSEQQNERIVPELTNELLQTLPVPIAAAVHQLKIGMDGQRRRAEAAERRQGELRAELEQQRGLADTALTEQAAKDVAALNAAYRERAHLVALLAAVYPAQFRENPDEDYEDWPILYVQLPTGQASWHISPRDTDLFPHVKFGTDAEWDGHTTDAKYARIRHLTAQTHAAAKHRTENQEALKPLRMLGRRIVAANDSEAS